MTTEAAPPDVSATLAALHARIGALEASVQKLSAPAPPPPSSAAPPQKDLESAVDQMVANALLHGRRTAGVMSGLFNITPGLSGR